MIQREVAERVVATSKERAGYGRLAALCGWRAQARIPFDVQASAFTPPPEVTSRLFSRVTQAAFGQRRGFDARFWGPPESSRRATPRRWRSKASPRWRDWIAGRRRS